MVSLGNSYQTPQAVVMIRPAHFGVNAETAEDNAYQEGPSSDAAMAKAAFDEVTAMARALEAAGITVHLYEDEASDRPDAVFPNNWFSTHRGGQIVLYPMKAPSRRRERRQDITDNLKARYGFEELIDISAEEKKGQYLEGTGAFVFDHDHARAFLSPSPRADAGLAEKVCRQLGYELTTVGMADRSGQPVYHTNVILSIGTKMVLAALDMCVNDEDRAALHRYAAETGKQLISLTEDQIGDFAGNAIELQGTEGSRLLMSARGWASLTPQQREEISEVVDPLIVAVPTIEKSGGSVRCMVAGVHPPTS